MSLGAGNKAEKSARSILLYLSVTAVGAVCYKAAIWAHNPKAGGLFLGLTVLFIFYGFCFLVAKAGHGIDFIKNLPEKEQVRSLLWLIGLNAFTYLEMAREKKIYYWDASTYWQKTVEGAQQLFQSPGMLVHAVYCSINENDYNMIVPMLLALPTRLFGNDHMTHVLLILNLFLVPAALVIAMIAKQAGGDRAPSFSFLLGTVLLLPAFTYPVLAGYLDAFSLLTLALSFELILTVDFSSFDWYGSCLLAGAFLLSLLGRRYFVYPVIGMTAAFFITFLLYFIQKRPGWKTFLRCAANFLLIGAVCFTVCFFSFRPFLSHAISGSFAQKYSAYQRGSFLNNWELFALYFGALIVAVCLVGAVKNIIAKRAAYPVFLIADILVTASLFYRVQSMDAHHYYIVVIPVLLLLADAVCAFRDAKPIRRKAAAWVAFSIVCLTFLGSYANPCSPPNSFMVSSVHHLPEARSDLPTIRELASRLNQLSGKNQNAKIYLLSSSKVLNYSILQNIDAPDSFQFVPALYSTSEVDRRDGFPFAFLKSGLVVVCEPTQYCVDPGGQRVVGTLADDVLRNRQIAGHFRLVEQYRLKDNVTAKVFLKTSQFTAADLKLIEDQFNRVYPSWHLDLKKQRGGP